MSFSIKQATDGSLQVKSLSNGVSSTVLDSDPDAKILVTKVFAATRAMTTATNAFTLPVNAIPISISIYAGTASNAGTTATLSVGKTGTNTFFVSAQDVKGASGQIACAAATNLGAAVSTTAATQVVVIYAETGTASSAGGPFLVKLSYYLV